MGTEMVIILMCARAHTHTQNMPIVKLKECIEECTGVPTHRQRLTMGSTILEDWDHEDRMMFIGDYPSIHDGSLLYLVQLEGENRLSVKHYRDDQQFRLTKKAGSMTYSYQTTHFYVNSIKVRKPCVTTNNVHVVAGAITIACYHEPIIKQNYDPLLQ